MGSDNSRGKDKWAESNKVYTRRFPNRGAKKPGNNVAVVVEADTDCNRSKNGSVVARDQPCLPTLELETAENGNSLPPQKCVSLSSRFDLLSDDDWSQHGAAAPPNGCEPSNGNKSDVVKVEDGSRINQSEGASDDSSHAAAPAPRPNGRQSSCGDYVGVVKANDKARIDNLDGRLKKSDIKKKRRELIAELGQLRSLMKKLQAWEAQLNSNPENGDYIHSQVSAMEVAEKGGAGSRMNPVVGFMENGHEVAGFVENDKRTAKVNQYCRNSDFLLGRDRSLPKSNKRLKANKHGEDVDFRFRMDRHKIQAFKNCGTLLAKLMRHKHGWVFNTPVDVKGLGLHDYYTIIKHPMDLGTVKGRLNKKGYNSPKEFAEDVRLTFRNAMAYNPKGHDVHIMAEMLSKIFEEKWTVIETKYNLDGCNGIGHKASVLAPTAIQTLPSLPPPQPPLGTRSFEFNRSKSMGRPIDSNSKAVSYASVGRTPGLNEPKAKDPPIRDMTYEEKQRLSTNLQTLPFDKLDDIVQIIRKRNTALSQHDDEIEVEIDSVDAETLWELDRFVTDHEQSLRRKKAEMAFRARQEAGQTIHETNPTPAPAMVDSPKEAKRVSPPRMEIQGHDASQSSSSSSSSSDSQSSSSDSDSDSSSACEPDGSHSPKT